MCEHEIELTFSLCFIFPRVGNAEGGFLFSEERYGFSKRATTPKRNNLCITRERLNRPEDKGTALT